MISAALGRVRARAAAFANDDVMAKLARGGLAALVIKVGGAGLSFLMFLMLARAMSVEEYGRFGFAFSLATLLAVIGTFGFGSLVLRYAPAYDADGATEMQRGVIRYGYIVTVAGCGILGLGVVGMGAIVPGFGHPYYLMAAGAFTLVLGLAEYQAHVMRAITGITLSLVPRDIIWRLIVMAGCGLVMIGLVPDFTAGAAMAFITVALFLVILGQALAHPMTRPDSLVSGTASFEGTKWWSTAWGLWGTMVVRMAAPNLAVIFVGLMLSPIATGPFFAAIRTAMLLNLFLMSSGMVVAPAIARHFHRNEIDVVRKLCLMTVAAVAIPTLMVFITFVFFGREILSLFGEGFESGYGALLILSAGNLVNALSGPTAQIMEMTGAERPYLRMILVTNILALIVILSLTPVFGVIGAAIGVAFGMSAWNIWCILYARKTMGIDPSILAAFQRRT
ncbi:lipopolysaccharide biosynthesis protein [Pelagibacterium halotolerans]|uniref:Polysaccharide biosynthesis associate n=1 Tax=Pelagibacterium halotolerans (strain DSM 22347 / JCM 15775 / CGMCC 1.7692 / B2) TaxID=1082931 RepID=G4RGV9_PELHB|nr:oligosaccharide flippase family protein [Pelagibacterium halotolerans]AEQ53112.1 polysaccharide biosynthesis associate [Pelagibacterium halotolerans B2]QJR17247.1 oligosaccharide flippase family protein [Pelagibacterium halotolerans]SEA98869.1 Membrane protein involved in the export of O-antigen and teichoic acid [Pelagibacterium halotolerans]